MSFQWNITPPSPITGLVKAIGVETGDLEWWYSLPTDVKNLKEGSIIVIKVKGGMFWSSRGQQRYSGTRFMVLRIVEVRSTEYYPVLYRCEEIVEFPVRIRNYSREEHHIHEFEEDAVDRWCISCGENT